MCTDWVFTKHNEQLNQTFFPFSRWGEFVSCSVTDKRASRLCFFIIISRLNWTMFLVESYSTGLDFLVFLLHEESDRTGFSLVIQMEYMSTSAQIYLSIDYRTSPIINLFIEAKESTLTLQLWGTDLKFSQDAQCMYMYMYVYCMSHTFSAFDPNFWWTSSRSIKMLDPLCTAN